jgi:hypothetical protein
MQMSEKSKVELRALFNLMKEARSETCSQTAADRCARSAKVLGFKGDDLVRIFIWLDYCDTSGRPWNPLIKKVW